MTDREHAYFHVTGPNTHETITQVLGFTPSHAWNAGDISPSTGHPYRAMHWRLDSGLEQSVPLIQHVDALLLHLGTRAKELRSLWLDHDLTLQCVGYYAGSHGLHLNREHIRRAAVLGLAVDLDLYATDD